MRFKLALQEIRHHFGFSLAFIFNLALGLTSFLLLSSLNVSIQESFSSRSKAILSADLAVSSRRAFTEGEERKIQELTRNAVAHHRAVELYAMIATQSGTRLSDLVAVEESFPLYGELQLEKQGIVKSASPKDIIQSQKVWISPEFSIQMKVKIGESIKIGDLWFEVQDVVEKDSGNSFRGFALAPKVYLGLEPFKKTGLLKLGSTLSYQHYYRFGSEGDLDQANRRLNQELRDPGIQITTHQKAGEQTSRVLAYLADYLGLVTLVGLFLAAMGSTFLFHSFISGRVKEIATLISLGLPSPRAIEVYLLQVLVLALVAIVFSTLGALVLIPVAKRILAGLLDFDFELRLPLTSFLNCLWIGVFTSFLICLPLIRRIRRLKPSILFQESQTQELSFNFKSALGFGPAVLFFYVISVFQAHSFKIGSLFCLGLLVSGIVLSVVVMAGLKTTEFIKWKSLPFKLAHSYLIRNSLSTLSAFVSIGLGAVLINFLPQVQGNIESEITMPKVSRIPSLFLFDIQEEQLPELKKFFDSKKDTEHSQLMQVSPLIRARILTVGGIPFERSAEKSSLTTREQEQESRLRNRGVNLTYREFLSESETLIAGTPLPRNFNAAQDKLPEISVEQRYASQLGVKLGDVMGFDIQGIPLQAKVTSLRRVKWTSFQPNFFIEFQPGVLEEAPKTYIAAVDEVSKESRIQLQNQLVGLFPNVSVIDVSTVTQRVLQLFGQMSWALRVIAVFSVFTGMVVLFSIARYQAQSRKTEVQLLKLLGGTPRLINSTQWLEFGGLGLFAACSGVLLSQALSWSVSYFLFDSIWNFNPILPLVTVAGITSLTLIVTRFAVHNTLREKPASLLS